ncbi:hypothetical protein H0H87_010060 [Tephrocybe sp. NHM501043]|nr:hypothetical protein H0H87_010060 [Tephrocybe sp. NHM501043]
MACKHDSLVFYQSTYAECAGYIRPPPEKLVAATLTTGRVNKDAGPNTSPGTFPAPLVLPEDDLSLDPRCPQQSLRSWLREKDRNPVTPDKNVIYVAAPPRVNFEVDFMRSWVLPRTKSSERGIKTPSIDDVSEYLQAFYHGLPVKPLPAALTFTSWDTPTKTETKTIFEAVIPKYIGLNITTECVGIRVRASRDGIYAAQLNLDDCLDAAISILPEDAYALLLLVDHDLFESDDDEFVCGRAYGGSRVAVISTARYHPLLDSEHNVDRRHSWPASHCTKYVRKCCASTEPSSKPPKKKARLQPEERLLRSMSSAFRNQHHTTPMWAALSAFTSIPFSSPSPAALSGLWLGRVCRTASHELGHCFGMEHCVYYACAMQGSASLAEDSRQPPYLCPVDLAKISLATGSTEESRYQALLSFCAQHEDNQLFLSYAAWIRASVDSESL